MVSSQLCHTGNRRLLFLLGVLAVNYLLFQSILVPYGNGNAPWSSVPQKYDNVRLSLHSTPKYFTVWNPPTGTVSGFSNSSAFIATVQKVHIPIVVDEVGHGKKKGMHNNVKGGLVSERNGSDDNVFEHGADRNDVRSLSEKKDVGKGDRLELESVVSKNFIADSAKGSKVDFSVKQFLETKRGASRLVKDNNMDSREHDGVGVHTSDSSTFSTNLENSPQKIVFSASDNSTAVSIPRRKMRCMMPPKSRTLFQEMNRILVRKRASARAMVLILISLSIMS